MRELEALNELQNICYIKNDKENTENVIKLWNCIKQALTRPLDSEVEEALKYIGENYQLNIRKAPMGLLKRSIEFDNIKQHIQALNEKYCTSENENYELRHTVETQASEIKRLKQENQDLKIDKYQQKNLIKKYHNNDFPLLHKKIEEQDEKLNAIREVFKEDYTPNQVCTEILQILGDSER